LRKGKQTEGQLIVGTALLIQLLRCCCCALLSRNRLFETQMAKMLDVLEAFLNLHGHISYKPCACVLLCPYSLCP
jgi:hypothetical protein